MKSKFFLSLIVVMFLIEPALFAKSKKAQDGVSVETQLEDVDDLSLFEIDRLIRRTEYDEALRQLNTYIANNPENFDNAQIRIRRIMNARKQYSILAEKLIDIILNDPNNNKEIYEITAQLEKFEKHPSDQNLQFIADLKKSAEFNYFRSLFMEIQTASAELTGKNQYVQALAKCQEGFWLYKDEFYDRWEENKELLSQVDSILVVLDEQIKLFGERNFLTRSSDVVEAFVDAVNKDKYAEANAACETLAENLRDFISVRNALMNCGAQMQELFTQLQEIDADTSDASFLPFMFRFVFGIDTVPESGIAGAVNKIWNNYMTKMNNAVFAQLNNKYRLFLSEPNDSNSAQVVQYAMLDTKLLDLNNVLESGRIDEIKANYEDFYVLCDYVDNLSKETVRVRRIYEEVARENIAQQTILTGLQTQKEGNRAASIRTLFNSNAKIGTLVGVKAEQELENYEWAQPYIAASFDNWKDLTSFYNTTLNNIFDTSAIMLDGSWRTLSAYYKDSADNLCRTVETHIQNSNKYFEGFYVKIPWEVHSDILKNANRGFALVNTFENDEELNFGVYYSYPDIAVSLAKITQNEVNDFVNEISGYQVILQENYSAHQQWLLDENITSIVTSTTEYLEQDKNKLSSLKTASISTQELAQSQIIASQLAQNEADIRYAEAEAALRRDNFELARKKLQDSATKYDEALKNQDNGTLRFSLDEKLLSLGDRITKGENEIVVKEVRQLKNLAKDAYLNGRFDDAEKFLAEAKQRWAVTNATEDSEITNLMNFVNTAISMKTGREILPSAPQYPEMSQLLNIANQYYESGTEKIKKGDKTGGNDDLDLALQNIQKVQFTYPLNRDAALLTLRINKLRDPDKFKDELSQKIDLAKMMCKRKDSQQEGYANLLDYYDIEPNYRGLKDLIYQVEIDIGIRQKPVDNSGTKKADSLLAAAQRLFKNAGTDQAKLQAALAKVDEAIILRDTEAAQKLKDQITITIGGNTAVTLSTDDERLYRSAIAKLQSNDIFGANRIVQQLLQNPRNANLQQIKDLKSKVDARL